MSTQRDLQFLIKNNWKLIGINLVESPDGLIQTTDITNAAKYVHIKLDIQKRFANNHLTSKLFWNKLF